MSTHISSRIESASRVALAVTTGPRRASGPFGVSGWRGLPGALLPVALLAPVLLIACLHAPVGVIVPCTPPVVIHTTPQHGEEDVPRDDTISVTFNTPIDTLTVDSTTFTVLSEGDTISGEIWWDPGDTTVYFDPVDSLLPNTTYIVILTPGIEDSLGNPLDTPYVFVFTTEDTVPDPPGADIFPKPGDEGVPVDVVIAVSFDDPPTPDVFDTNTIVLVLGTDTIPGDITWDSGDSTLTFDPVDSLLYDTTYTVLVTVPTETGGPLGPVDTTYTWTFTTVDSVPKAPQLEAINDGAIHSLSANTYKFVNLVWWAGPSSAVTFQLQVSTSPAFTTTVYDVANIPYSSGVVTRLLPHSTLPPALYYWRVNATSSGGTSPWSTVWTFTTTP